MYHWIWYPVVQDQMNKILDSWNNHKIRYQRNKLLDSGMTPYQSYQTASNRGQVNCFVPVSPELIAEFRQEVWNDLSARGETNLLEFWTSEQDELLSHYWQSVGGPRICRDTAWDVFLAIQGILPAEFLLDHPIWDQGPEVRVQEEDVEDGNQDWDQFEGIGPILVQQEPVD